MFVNQSMFELKKMLGRIKQKEIKELTKSIGGPLHIGPIYVSWAQVKTLRPNLINT